MNTRKTRLQRLMDNMLVEDALRLVMGSTPSGTVLANPSVAAHAVTMFAIENRVQFRQWLNEGAGGPGDPPKTQAQVDEYLRTLHKIVDAAMVASDLEAPLPPVA